MDFDHVYVDMDGVLCDFVHDFLQLHDRMDLYDHMTDPHLPTAMHLSPDILWRPVIAAGAGFWENLPAYPWAAAIMRFARSLGEVTIVTRPLNSVGSLAPLAVSQSTYGKLRWLDKHLGVHPDDVVFTGKKHAVARTGALLIEDIDAYVPRFIAYGGQVLIVPQSYNKYRDSLDDRMGAVYEQFEDLREEVACS